jgi:hypothetical protein
VSDRADTLARLAVCAAEAREMLLACGLDRCDDASVAGAIADADAELEHSAHTLDGLAVRALRRRRDVLIAVHEYLAQTTRARRALAQETQ